MGGYSYQDIDSRLRTVEDMLLFMMQTMRMKGAITSGVVDAQGRPQARVFDGSLLDMYRLSRTLPTIEQVDAPPPIEEPPSPVDEVVG